MQGPQTFLFPSPVYFLCVWSVNSLPSLDGTQRSVIKSPVKFLVLMLFLLRKGASYGGQTLAFIFTSMLFLPLCIALACHHFNQNIKTFFSHLSFTNLLSWLPAQSVY